MVPTACRHRVVISSHRSPDKLTFGIQSRRRGGHGHIPVVRKIFMLMPPVGMKPSRGKTGASALSSGSPPPAPQEKFYQIQGRRLLLCPVGGSGAAGNDRYALLQTVSYQGLIIPGETMNRAPAASARRHCSTFRIVPAPTKTCGQFSAIWRIDSSPPGCGGDLCRRKPAGRQRIGQSQRFFRVLHGGTGTMPIRHSRCKISFMEIPPLINRQILLASKL